MSAEALAYPFLFIAIFFESFVLVTFLSKPARLARARKGADELPTVAIVVPCWNEATTLAGTTESLLALDYPKDKLEIVLVDDGSTDGTKEAMAKFEGNPQVRLIYKENGGKHTALNAGIAATSAELIGCLDADSFVEPDSLREIVSSFEDETVAATTAAMSVHKPENLLQHMQNAEYIFGIALRHTLSSVNGLYVTPGPFSFYRRSVITELGGFRYGNQAEDMEMALRIQREGRWRIENAPRARVYTKAPANVLRLVKQRTRWTSGFLRNVLNEYRSLVGNRRYGALGMIVLPVGITAIGSGIALFLLALVTLSSNALSAIEVRAGIPMSYVFALHGRFDWFYLPASVYVLLAAATILASLSLIVVGKRLSNTPGNIATGVISYVLLYGFVVPLWLLRASADVMLGRKRSWR